MISFVFIFDTGNEARQFGIEDGSYTFTATPFVPVYKIFTNFDGNVVQYVG